MKKIFYILFTVSLLSVSCTKEVVVTRNHDLNAEVLDMQTKTEMKTLYCNLNEALALDLEQLDLYLAEQNADVSLFVAPAVIGEEDFVAWLQNFVESEKNIEQFEGSTVLSARNDDGLLVMAAIVKAQWQAVQYEIIQSSVMQLVSLNNAVLHFSIDGMHFVVTELYPAKNAIPEDWEKQINDMRTNKETVPLVYTPDVLAERKAELVQILSKTIDSADHMNDKHWIWAVNMNVESPLDITKYEKVFSRYDYYDNVTPEFIAKKHNYFSISENLDAKDIFFGVHELLLSYNMVDCNAVHHSIYTPSTVKENEELYRRNFLYASDDCWNMFQTFDVDTVSAVNLGVSHYPFIVTLKSEE